MIKGGQDVKNSFKIRFSAKFWCRKHSQTSSRAHLVNLTSITQKKILPSMKKHAKKLKIHHICQVIANNKG